MTQTGGACRASNYVGFIRRALKDAGYDQIPVLAVSVQGIESHSGFTGNLTMLKRMLLGVLYGDLLMRLSSRIRPYEYNPGETDQLLETWTNRCRGLTTHTARREFEDIVEQIVKEFDAIPRSRIEKPKVGIVGEILVKYLPEANNFLQETLEKEGMEVIVPDLADFLFYCMENSIIKKDYYGTSGLVARAAQIGIYYVDSYRNIMRRVLKKYGFDTPPHVDELRAMAKRHVSLGHQLGEGWLLTAEMVERLAGAQHCLRSAFLSAQSYYR